MLRVTGAAKKRVLRPERGQCFSPRGHGRAGDADSSRSLWDTGDGVAATLSSLLLEGCPRSVSPLEKLLPAQSLLNHLPLSCLETCQPS